MKQNIKCYFFYFQDLCVSKTYDQNAPNPNGIIEQTGPKSKDSIQNFMTDIMSNKITLPDILSGKVQLPANLQDFGKEIAVHVISILLANVAVTLIAPQAEPFFG